MTEYSSSLIGLFSYAACASSNVVAFRNASLSKFSSDLTVDRPFSCIPAAVSVEDKEYAAAEV